MANVIQINAPLWSTYVVEELPYQGSLLGLGVIQLDDSQEYKEGDVTRTIPTLEHLDNIGDDYRVTKSTTLVPRNLSSHKELAPIMRRGNAIQDNELSKIISGQDAITKLTTQIAQYNARRIEASAVAAINGLFAAGGALKATHELDTSAVGDGKLSPESTVDAQALLGETQSQLTRCMLHSVDYANLKKIGLIDMADAGSLGESVFRTGEVPVYMGMMVAINDRLCAPYVSGADTLYPKYYVGQSPVYLGYQRQLQFESDREILTAGGVDILAWYVHYCIGVRGVSWVQPDGAKFDNPERADMARADSWSVVTTDNKRIQIVRHVTK